MSQFYNNPVVELINNDNGGLWRLYEPLLYISSVYGSIAVPRGFITDFASVPRFLFTYLLVGNTAHAAAIVHDFLYRKDCSKDLTKDQADAVFYEAMEATKIPQWRRKLIYAGVRVGGSSAYHKKLVFEAPS